MTFVLFIICMLVAIALVIAWLIWEWRMDRLAREDRQLWLDATRPVGERWPRRDEL